MKTILFSILITTKNRREDLSLTLRKIQHLLQREDVECCIYDDGSIDDTFDFVKNNYPQIKLQRNENSKGYLYCRNVLLQHTTAAYAISLDDDAHFVTENPLESIKKYFTQNPNCGVIALRIFWGLNLPENRTCDEVAIPVQGFVGCGHVWRMDAWHSIVAYPEWFEFYGEEDFAAYHLFKKKWFVHYLPEVLVQHRVALQLRKNKTDYSSRLRNSLSSGWYLLFMFTPIYLIPRKFIYSVWKQVQLKIFKGDKMAMKALLLAIFDLICAIPKILKDSNRLTKKEFLLYQKLPKTKIYWTPKEVNLVENQ